jgi:DNA-directed RNA polymerase specialized sigma24 family protein
MQKNLPGLKLKDYDPDGHFSQERAAMPSEPSVTLWLQLLKAGDRAAAQPLWEKYFAQLVRHARARLAGTFRTVADEEDVALSAFASFYRGIEQGRFPHLDDRHDLWRVLLMLVAQKRAHLIRRQTAAKRTGGLVDTAADLSPTHEERDAALAQAIGPEPTPAFAAQMVEECRRLLDKLGDEGLRSIAVWQMEGYTVEEMAERLGCSPRTIARKLAIIRDRWSDEGKAP